jgi:two-component system, LytTR family, response regulator
MQVITAIVVDDEALAREGLLMRLDAYADIHVLASCASGEEAYSCIRDTLPDVIFLDIEMPNLNGLQLIETMQQEKLPLPLVVFVTAFKEFALQAFEFQAFDYLLKPFSDDRLESCLCKVRNAFAQNHAYQQKSKLERLLGQKTGRSLDGFIQTLEQSSNTNMHSLQQTISLKSGNEWLRIALDGILWIEAAGDYMCVHTKEGTHIIRKTLKQFEQELDSECFPRVNRSVIVNLSKVTKLTPNSNGEYVAALCSGDEVKVGRKYKFKLDELKRN